MKNKQIIEKIRQLIGDGKIEEGLNKLETHSEIWVNTDSREIVLQLKSRISRLHKDSIKGIISVQEKNTEYNSITNSILFFLTNVEEVIDYHEQNVVKEINNQQLIETIVIPKYVGVKGIIKKIKLFFTKTEKKYFCLYLSRTKKYYDIECPDYIRVEHLSKYIADKLFPDLKEQHFIWRLENIWQPIPIAATVQGSGIKEKQTVFLTAEYKHHEDLWGKELQKKIRIETDQPLPTNMNDNQQQQPNNFSGTNQQFY